MVAIAVESEKLAIFTCLYHIPPWLSECVCLWIVALVEGDVPVAVKKIIGSGVDEQWRIKIIPILLCDFNGWVIAHKTKFSKCTLLDAKFQKLSNKKINSEILQSIIYFPAWTTCTMYIP